MKTKSQNVQFQKNEKLDKIAIFEFIDNNNIKGFILKFFTNT